MLFDTETCRNPEEPGGRRKNPDKVAISSRYSAVMRIMAIMFTVLQGRPKPAEFAGFELKVPSSAR